MGFLLILVAAIFLLRNPGPHHEDLFDNDWDDPRELTAEQRKIGHRIGELRGRLDVLHQEPWNANYRKMGAWQSEIRKLIEQKDEFDESNNQ